jgi:succinate-semialdehyde dehydrogenase/glutarate-semialdehyde dehydrogenase
MAPIASFRYGASRVKYQTVDPATGRLAREYPFASETDRRAAIDRAAVALASWRDTSPDHRAQHLVRAAEALDARATELARLMALEMGKTLAEGEAEIRKCATGCRYFAEHGPGFLAPVPHASDGLSAHVRHDPLGPILAIMPWNFPFWQFFRFAAPALVAGNVALLKHAPGTPGCALAIEGLLANAGFPEGAVQSLFLSNEQAADTIADPRVRGVTLTGSTRAGREVAATAGRWLKPSVLELGGSDAFVVLDDADLDRAIEVGVASRCLNNGQSCIAAKRFLVQAAVYERFRDGFVAGMRARVMGDPRDRTTTLGPLARRDLRDTLARQVEDSVRAGARVLCGGEVPEGEGFFYPATVLDDVPPDSPAATEELFGPVAALFPFDTEDDAVALANGTPYGLGASVWTRDPSRAERLVPRIEAGAVFVNGLVKSDPRLPFGGVRDSGWGRELARDGVLAFVNRKTVWIG